MDDVHRDQHRDKIRTLRSEAQPALLEPRGDMGTLPRYLTTFIGRDKEIAQVQELLARDDVRLLTLTGMGGSGKTRLAIEASARAPTGIWDDVWFIPLASVRDPDLVISAIAQAVGVRHVSGRPIEEALIRFLRERRALLLIDNFERVVAAGPRLGEMLAACMSITMLVTSRVTLHISGEHVVQVPPLALPHTGHLPLDQLETVESIQLFTERAKAVASDFTLTQDNASTVADICRRLDGLPLAMELAAARSASLSPVALLHLLQRQSIILSNGLLNAPDRHQSMRDAIAWSYDLLPDHEQAAFRELAVFSGGFSLSAAEAVVSSSADTFDTLSSLTTKSLLVPVKTDNREPRFTMLETLREYGLDRLEESGDTEATRDRHAAWFVEEAIQSEMSFLMPLEEGLRQITQLKEDHANMQDALGWLLHSGDIAACLHMAGSLGPLWVVCGHASEGRAWLERLLAIPPYVDDPIRANALASLSWLGNQQGTMEEAFRLAEEALAILQSWDAPIPLTRCLVLSGVAAAELGDFDLANARFREAMERTSALDGPDWLPNWLHTQLTQSGHAALTQGRLDEADAYYREAVDRQMARGYEPGTSHIYGSHVLTGMAQVAMQKGDYERALRSFQQSLELARRFSTSNVSIVNISIRLVGLIAGSLAGLGRVDNAARLFGASDALQQAYSYHFTEISALQRRLGLPARQSQTGEEPENSRPLHVQTGQKTPHVGKNIASDALLRAWNQGRMLSLESAIAEALAATAEPHSVLVEDAAHGLSPREMEVLRLLVDGLSNRVIAESLSLSERTIEHHVMHILTKLDLGSRTAAATWAIRQGIL